MGWSMQYNIASIRINILTGGTHIMIEKRQLADHEKRNSTDLTCLVIFISITIALLVLALYCYFNGSISKFNTPYDSSGKGCGTDYPNYNYIYFPSPQIDSLWVTTCVQQCPGANDKVIDCKTNAAVAACTENNSADNTKAFHIYPTFVFRGSVCLPVDQAIKQKVLGGLGSHWIEEMFGSVLKDWSLFLLIVPIVTVMALVAILLIRVTAGYVIYVLYFLSIAAFIGFGIFMAIPAQEPSNATFVLKKHQALSITVSVLSFILAGVILCLFCFYRKSIKTAVGFIDQSNEFFKNNYRVLILPFVLIAFLIVFLCFWTFLTLSFYSMSTPINTEKQMPFEHYRVTPLVTIALIINLFYLIWGVFFLVHTGNFVLSGTVVNWQYKRDDPYLTASKNYALSHMGSVCMGSFFTTLLGLFKIELDEADCAIREGEPVKQPKCTDYFKKCYGCLCCCCVNFLFRCFHHAAYTYQNLTGLAYCQCAGEVYELIRADKDEWSVIAFLYLIFDSFIPMAFTVVAALIGNGLINGIQFYQANTSNRILVLAIVGVIAYAIGQFFVGIYSQAIQSIFVINKFHHTLLYNKYMHPLQMQEQIQQIQDDYRSNKAPSNRLSLFPKSS